LSFSYRNALYYISEKEFRMTESVNCNIHGVNEVRMICQHLQNKSCLGYALVLVHPEEDDCETVAFPLKSGPF